MQRHEDDEREGTPEAEDAVPAEDGKGFATGYDEEEPDAPEERRGPDYARGIDDEQSEADHEEGRFSEGGEELPDTPDKRVKRRFSEGIERSPDSD